MRQFCEARLCRTQATRDNEHASLIGSKDRFVTKRSAIEKAILNLAPRIPPHELGSIADHALDSSGLRQASPEAAAWLSMIAFIRHVLTDYDALLEEGYDQESARHFVVDDIRAILSEWGVRRPLSSND